MTKMGIFLANGVLTLQTRGLEGGSAAGSRSYLIWPVCRVLQRLLQQYDLLGYGPD